MEILEADLSGGIRIVKSVDDRVNVRLCSELIEDFPFRVVELIQTCPILIVS